MLWFLQWFFFLASIVAAFWIWVLPVLRQRPALKHFFDEADTFWGAVALRFDGIKTKLTAGLGMALTALYGVWDQLIPFVVSLWDSAAPVALQIDWQPIKDHIPSWLIPIVLFVMFWLIAKFRAMADRKKAEG